MLPLLDARDRVDGLHPVEDELRLGRGGTLRLILLAVREIRGLELVVPLQTLLLDGIDDGRVIEVDRVARHRVHARALTAGLEVLPGDVVQPLDVRLQGIDVLRDRAATTPARTRAVEPRILFKLQRALKDLVILRRIVLVELLGDGADGGPGRLALQLVRREVVLNLLQRSPRTIIANLRLDLDDLGLDLLVQLTAGADD